MRFSSQILSFFFNNTRNTNNFRIGKKVITNNKKYGTELINNDFLKFCNPEKRASIKDDILKSFNIYDEENYKFAHIDAEELSEFNFDFFLPRLNQILKKRNIILIVKKTSDYQNTHNTT